MFWEGFKKEASTAYLKAIGAIGRKAAKKPSVGSRLGQTVQQSSLVPKDISKFTQQQLKDIPRARAGAKKYVDIT